MENYFFGSGVSVAASVSPVFVGGRPNQSLELTAMEYRGSARKGKEEFALSGLGKRLLAAVQVGR
jgi:hypothetical protein